MVVIATHWLTMRRDRSAELRTRAALLSVIHAQADAAARISVSRRNALSDILQKDVRTTGRDTSSFAVIELSVKDQGPALLGLLPNAVTKELFGLSSTITEINRLAFLWGTENCEQVLQPDDLASFKALFELMLEEANDLSGLASYKLMSPFGRFCVFAKNLLRARNRDMFNLARQRTEDGSVMETKSNPSASVASSSDRADHLRSPSSSE